jgi:hypothetical protein
MNCKPGDLAIVKFGSFSGVLVHVLGAAPRTAFLLPDRWPTSGAGDVPSWVCEFAGGRQQMPLVGGGSRLARYAASPDINLTPIRDPGEGATDETLLWLPVPGKAVTA